MGKIIVLYFALFANLISQELDAFHDQMLQNKCLSCHVSQQIPDELIYRRYLIVYSTSQRMESAIFKYMKNPNKKNSVMHYPFFFRFPMKKKSHLKDETLQKMIKAYLTTFDIKNKLTNLE